MMARIDWKSYFMKMAQLAAERSTCIRRRVGAVAVRDNHVLATGYNGAPKGQTHCINQGCLRKELNIPSGERHEICRGVHAEQNIICQAALHGVSLEGAIIYCTTQPCSICARLIANSGIQKVIYLEGYPDEMTLNILRNILEPFNKAG